MTSPRVEVRRERLEEMLKYAREIKLPGVPLQFMKTPLAKFAQANYNVTMQTARDYAHVVILQIEYERKTEALKQELTAQ